MKQGKTLEALGRELQRQREARQDFIADTRSLEMTTKEGGSRVRLYLGDNPQDFAVGEVAHQQISARLGIPLKYYQRMQTEAPALLDENVNNWLQQAPERRMLRAMDGNVRAFLSDRYRRLDNLILEAVLEAMAEYITAKTLPAVQERTATTKKSTRTIWRHLS